MHKGLLGKMSVLGLLMAAATVAAAADSGSAGGGAQRMSPQDRFAAMDANHDGKVSLAEYQAAIARMRSNMGRNGAGGGAGGGQQGGAQQGGGRDMSAMIEGRFKAIDTNHDGFLSQDEFTAGQGKGGGRRGDFRGRRGGGQGGAGWGKDNST